MPEAVAAAAAAAPQNGQQPRQGSTLISTLLRMAFFWYMASFFRNDSQKAATNPDAFLAPMYKKGTVFDMYAFISEEHLPSNFLAMKPIWVEKSVGLATSPERKLQITYTPSEAVKNNGSVYMHVGFVEKTFGMSEEEDSLPSHFDFVKTFSLNEYLPKPKNKTGLNLLKSDQEAIRQLKEQRQNEGPPIFLNFWKPACSVVMVDHFNTYPKSGIPPQMRPLFQIDETDGRHYYPLVSVNNFWLLKDKYIAINETATTLPLNLSISTQNFWFHGIQSQIEQSFQMQASTGLSTGEEADEFKRVLIEGNPYLLALTFAVSMLHTVFDMLAFKNDIGFWKDNKSMEGLSARSVLINAGCQLVILLYLFDNETSFVVLLSSGLGTAIEFWKVTKAMDVSFDWSRFPYIKLRDKASYTKTKTKEYDEQATRYLSYVLYPLVFGYAIYTLMYQTHKSWYSWVVGSLVGAVYMFGFILMCPQLYLNYKLKSVAHLPWRQMTYKFLNTIIDDLFAFVIKMPTLHRLSVFRDDLIFLIYIYQRWIYRVDKTRVNEFGYSEAPAEGEAEGEGEKQLEGEGEVPKLTDAAEGKKATKRKGKKAASDGEGEGSGSAAGAADTVDKKND